MVEMRKLLELLKACMNTGFNPIDDRRIPAPDVRGILADCQIRKQQLDEIAKEIGKNWPGVHDVGAGAYDNRPYFAIYLDPFSRKLQIQHWNLADRINSIIGTDGFSYFFLPRTEQSQFSSEVIIYNRDNIH